jgi:sec-independent protein translocase protein TatB
MFNVGPMELLVLAVVGLIVLGPDRLPQLARDAARMLRTLRDMATGAREQLRDELGPEFADLDLRSLHPRTAVQRVLLGDELDLKSLDPRAAVRDALTGGDEHQPTPSTALTPLSKPPQQPLGRGERAPFDSDAT